MVSTTVNPIILMLNIFTELCEFKIHFFLWKSINVWSLNKHFSIIKTHFVSKQLLYYSIAQNAYFWSKIWKDLHGGGGAGPSTMFILRNIDLNLVFCYIRPCNFLWKLPITHFSIKIKNKKWVCSIFWSKKFFWDFRGIWGP